VNHLKTNSKIPKSEKSACFFYREFLKNIDSIHFADQNKERTDPKYSINLIHFVGKFRHIVGMDRPVQSAALVVLLLPYIARANLCSVPTSISCPRPVTSSTNH